MKFARFMAGPIGRGARILVGIAVLIWGVTMLASSTVWGVVLLALGAFFIIVGVANICVFAPLFGGPFNGRKLK